MPVRILEPRQPGETLEQYQRRVEAHEAAVEADAEALRRTRERVDALTGRKR